MIADVPDLPLIADGPPPRERADAARNRLRILEAAAELVDERGIERVSMEDVACRAGVGTGTLYRRFGDRAGLALALLEEQRAAMQEGMIRGPAPLGPGAPPKERLAAMARAQLALLDEHHELMAAGDMGRPGTRFNKGPYVFLRVHATTLIRAADPDADAELLADILVAPLTADAFLYWRRVRGFDVERIACAFDMLVERLLP
jgi:AcrR family transcriptional regulator